MKLLKYIKQKYSESKDIVLIWRINRMLKAAKKEEVKIPKIKANMSEEAIKIDRNIEWWLQTYNHQYVSFQRGCEQDLTDRILHEVEGLA